MPFQSLLPTQDFLLEMDHSCIFSCYSMVSLSWFTPRAAVPRLPFELCFLPSQLTCELHPALFLFQCTAHISEAFFYEYVSEHTPLKYST